MCLSTSISGEMSRIIVSISWEMLKDERLRLRYMYRNKQEEDNMYHKEVTY